MKVQPFVSPAVNKKGPGPRLPRAMREGHYLMLCALGPGADRLSERTEKVKTGICVCYAIGPKDRAERTRSSLIAVILIFTRARGLGGVI